jgi:hypothetical protein
MFHLEETPTNITWHQLEVLPIVVPVVSTYCQNSEHQHFLGEAVQNQHFYLQVAPMC